MTPFVSVKSKLLLAFAVFLTAITLLNLGVTAYLTNRHSEAEAFNRLSQQLMQLQDDLQGARESLLGVAKGAAADEKNLSDMAILYSQELAGDKDPDPIRNRALGLNKTVSLNRLRLILGSARLSSLAVYLNGELSHYVTPDQTGMIVRRGTQHVVVATGQNGRENEQLDNWQDWSERPLPVLVSRRWPRVEQVTAEFEFPADQLMALRVVVPIQGVTRESFNETIAERLAIATREMLHRPDVDDTTPDVVGLFVFSKAFDTNFLRDIATNTGVWPAVSSPDGRHRVQLLDMAVPPASPPGRDDPPIRLQTAAIGGTPYYQASKLWRTGGESALVLGSALSRDGTLSSVRQTILRVISAALLILGLGAAIGYVLISRMVTPIKALTAAATAMDLGARDMGDGGEEHALYPTLGRYLENPIVQQSDDEIGELTAAFNAMSRRLHDLIASLARSEAYLAEAQQLSHTGSFSWNVASGAIVWSDETFRIFEYDRAPSAPTVEMFLQRVHPGDLARVKGLMDRGSQDGTDVEFDHRLQMPSGSTKRLHVVARAHRDRAGDLEFVGAVMDVTEQHRLYADLQQENVERRLAEETLEDLAGRLIHAQEEERSRIGRELHDHISQRLGLLAIKLDQCRSLAASTPWETLRATFGSLRRDTSEITEDIHRLSHRLHSSMLDHLGLVPALHRLVTEFSERHHIAIDFAHLALQRPVSPDVALCLFRIVEEALTNVAKHSGAGSARVSVTERVDGIGVTIEDAGVGFNPTMLEKEAGLGLVSMRERLRLVHGTIRIDSAPSRGTRVDAWVPVAHMSA